MVDSYLPIALVILAAAILAAGMITASHVLGRLSAGRRKVDLSPYECGVPPQDASHKRLTIRFYLVAMLFILFDVETAYLFPWATVYRKMGLFGLIEMAVFIGILIVGYIYVWRRGALEWK
ncbi:MAG: NADH-quinone oxidoreductase subunit A [Acidobacteriota bacterium]|nr:NADH-quinone oxidoreductase subunit A [Acidobacteriota bacterium]